LGGSIESTPPEGQAAQHGDDVCGMIVLVVDNIFHTIPTAEIPLSGSSLFLLEPF
jgi:hypothetical protein